MKAVKTYNGNMLLKRAGQNIEWTPELIKEYMKCEKDPIYFIETYMKIISDDGLVGFKLYPYQKKMIRSFAENRFNIVTTARQAGKCVTENTEVSIKFLDSNSYTFKIVTVHNIFSDINKYKSLYLGKTYEDLGKQIYKNLLLFNKEEANKFNNMWGETSYNTRKSWWENYTRKLSNVDSERTFYSPSFTFENVCKGVERTQKNALCLVDDVSYQGKNINNFSTIRKVKTQLYTNAFGEYDWRKQSFLWKEMGGGLSPSERLFWQNQNTGTEGCNFKSNENSLVFARSKETTRKSNEDFRKSKNSKFSEDWNNTNTRIKLKKKSNIERKIQNTNTSFKIQKTFNGTKEQIKFSTIWKAKIRRNKKENERSLGSQKEKKFIETFNINGFLVATDIGWKNLLQSHKTIKYKKWTLKTNSFTLNCADNHIVFDKNYNEVFVKDLKLSDSIWTKNGLEKVVQLFSLDKEENMYDFGVDDYTHRYYTNGILSHNSTTTCGFILWFIIFNSEKTVALLANKGDTAREILGKVHFGYQHLPKWLQQGVEKWNEGSMELENNSRVIASATSADAIRGYSIDLLFIDEAAHIDNWQEFFTSVFPTISSRKSSKVILVSTPNGLNHFYKTWALALEGKNGYTPIKVDWREVPGRDEQWKQKMLEGLNFDLEKFAQENECVTGDTIITVRDKITKIESKMTIEECLFWL